MVVFVLTKHGLTDLIASVRDSKKPIWVNHGLLDAPDLARLREDGTDLTYFTNWVDPSDGEAVQEAVATIKEHHPRHAIFVESILVIHDTGNE